MPGSMANVTDSTFAASEGGEESPRARVRSRLQSAKWEFMPDRIFGGLFCALRVVVPAVGLEPTLLSEQDFESSVSTNFTTPASTTLDQGRSS